MSNKIRGNEEFSNGGKDYWININGHHNDFMTLLKMALVVMVVIVVVMVVVVVVVVMMRIERAMQ